MFHFLTVPHVIAHNLTINEPYTIFDTNIAYTDRRWIYTAISRCVSFDQITIFKHSDNECKALEKCKYNQYFDLKIKNYIQQDIIASRITKDNDNLYYKGCLINNYIDSNWIKEQKQKCVICNENFVYELEDGKIISNMSVDRIKNDLPHTNSNCQMCCVYCNRSKRNL